MKYFKPLFLTFIALSPFTSHALQVQTGLSKNYRIDSDEGIRFVKCTKIIKTQNYKNSFNDLDIFLKSYKPETIKLNLHRVVFCKELHVNNKKWYRGTYDLKNKTIIIEVGGASDTEYMLHHEFSSILIKFSQKYNLLKTNWIKFNKERYVDVWSGFSKSRWNSENRLLRKNGFLFPYCKTNFENKERANW